MGRRTTSIAAQYSSDPRIVKHTDARRRTHDLNQGFLESSSSVFFSCEIKMNQNNQTNNEETASIGEELDENFVFNDSSSLNRYGFDYICICERWVLYKVFTLGKKKNIWKLFKILLVLIIFNRMNTDNDALIKFWF